LRDHERAVQMREKLVPEGDPERRRYLVHPAAETPRRLGAALHGGVHPARDRAERALRVVRGYAQQRRDGRADAVGVAVNGEAGPRADLRSAPLCRGRR